MYISSWLEENATLLVRNFIKQPHYFQETFHRLWSEARYCPLLELCNEKMLWTTWSWICNYTISKPISRIINTCAHDGNIPQENIRFSSTKLFHPLINSPHEDAIFIVSF